MDMDVNTMLGKGWTGSIKLSLFVIKVFHPV